METQKDQVHFHSDEEAPIEGWLSPTPYLADLIVSTMRKVYDSDFVACSAANYIKDTLMYQWSAASLMENDDPNKRLALFLYPKLAHLFNSVVRTLEKNISNDVEAMCRENPRIYVRARKFFEEENASE